MAKHWQNVLAGADHAMRCAHEANELRTSYLTRFGHDCKVDGHTCEEWVAIAIRRYARAAAMFDREQQNKSLTSSLL